MSQIIINSKSYSGNNLTITSGKVFIDGTEFTPNDKIINIEVTGDNTLVNVDVCEKVTVKGNAANVKTISGEVSVIGNVEGSVSSTSGDICCENVGGDLSTISGDIHCSKVAGKAKTVSGDITIKENSGSIKM